MKKCKKEYDFTGLACEITGDALYLINGGKEIGNSYAEQAQASPGDTVTDSNGVTHELNQGDIDWAKQKIAGQETATQTTGNAGAGNTPGANHNTGNQREDRDLRVTPENYQDPATDARGYYSTGANYQTADVNENNSIKGNMIEGKTVSEYKTVYSSRPAYALVEGIGANGMSIFNTCVKSTNTGTVEVNAYGKFIADHLTDSSEFFGTATLTVDGEKVETKTYKIDTTKDDIWNGNYNRIGSVTFDYDISNAKSVQVISDVDLMLVNYGTGKYAIDYQPTIVDIR